MGIEAPSFVYTSEIFPAELRAQGVAFSMQGLFLSSVLWTAVAAPALASIKWGFYIVFIGTSVMMFLVVFFFFPEVRSSKGNGRRSLTLSRRKDILWSS